MALEWRDGTDHELKKGPCRESGTDYLILKAISIQGSYYLWGFYPKDGEHCTSIYSFQFNLPLVRLSFPLLLSEVIVYFLLHCNVSFGENKEGRGICVYMVSCDFSSNLFLFPRGAALAEPSLVGLPHTWKIRHLKLCLVLLQSS